MAFTDGLVLSSESPWDTIPIGLVSYALADVYVQGHLRLTDGPIPGVAVDASGNVYDGPTVSFFSLNDLPVGQALPYGSAPLDPPPAIIWSGVSPTSLQELVIVFDRPIFLLNALRISVSSGDDTRPITVFGRIMVIPLSYPVSLDGQKSVHVDIGPGAIASYARIPSNEPPADSSNTPLCYRWTTSSNSSFPDVIGSYVFCAQLCSQLLPEADYVFSSESAATEAILSASTGTYPSNAVYAFEDSPGVRYKYVFTNSALTSIRFEALPSAPSSECLPPITCVDDSIALVVNNGLAFDTGCTFPFSLVSCSFDCSSPAPSWAVSLYVSGRTSSVDSRPLSRLIELDPTAIPAVYPGFIDVTGEVGCGVSVYVNVEGVSGELVQVEAVWAGELPGYPGQPVTVDFCSTACSGTLPAAYPDDARCYVDEDIIKPIDRILPVQFAEPLLFTTTAIPLVDVATVTLPSAAPYNVTLLEIPDSIIPVKGISVGTGISVYPAASTTIPKTTEVTIGTTVIDVYNAHPVTEVTSSVTWPAVAEAGLTLTAHTLDALTDVVFQGVTACAYPAAPGAYVTSIGSTVITLCDASGNSVPLTVVTSIGTQLFSPTTVAETNPILLSTPFMTSVTKNLANVATIVAAQTLTAMAFVDNVYQLGNITAIPQSSSTINVATSPKAFEALAADTDAETTTLDIAIAGPVTYTPLIKGGADTVLFVDESPEPESVLASFDAVRQAIGLPDPGADPPEETFPLSIYSAPYELEVPIVLDTVDVLIEGGDRALPELLPNGDCNSTFKFIMHDGESLQGTTITVESGSNCSTDTITATPTDIEAGCSVLASLSGLYVSHQTKTQSQYSAPCYDGAGELPCTDDLPEQTPLEFSAYTVPVRRLRRDLCARSNCT